MSVPPEGEEMREIIERACQERGWSLARLAGEAGLHPVGLWRALKKGNCYISTLARICGALGLDLSEFDLRSIPGLRWTAKTELGQQAQWLARHRGWTDGELAEHAGLTPEQLGAFMRGIVCPRSTIYAIEAALGRPLLDRPECPAWITREVCARDGQ